MQPSEVVHPKTFFYFLQAVSLPDRGYGRHFQYLRESQIPLPPLAEQIRIADKLDALLSRVDAGRERLERVPKLVKRFRQSVLSAAVSGELTREWREEDTTRSDAVKQVMGTVSESETPDSWQNIKFGHVVSLINGDRGKNYPNQSEYVKDGVAFINTGHIEPDGSLSLPRMNFISRAKFDTLGSGKIKKGDLVYCLRGATMGKTAFVFPFEEGAIASSLVIVRPSAKILSRFAYYFLVSPQGKLLIKQFDNGTAQPNLSAGSLSSYAFALPSLPEQAEIVRRVEVLFALADRLEARAQAALTRYSRLTPALLAKAFRGELVPQDPADEPASVLLERIRAVREAAGPAKKAAGRGRRAGTTTPRAEAGAQAVEPQPEPKRGRGRPRKGQEGAAQTSRSIPVAASAEEAMRLLQERARAEREGKVAVQAGLFGD